MGAEEDLSGTALGLVMVWGFGIYIYIFIYIYILHYVVCMSKHVEAARVIVWHELVVSEKNHA